MHVPHGLPQFFLAFIVFFGLLACGGKGEKADRLPVSSSDASLSNLSMSAGTLSPTFAAGTTSYTTTVTATTITATPTINDDNATVSVNGVPVTSGVASANIPLVIGNTIMTVVVTAQDGSTTQTYTITVSQVVLELLDPTPGASDEFGSIVVQLSNGNIVVSDPNDSSIAANNGAVHLYSPFSTTPIASIYGDVAGDQLGNNGITALGNNNYVVVSSNDDEGGIVDAGSVRLVDGSTGIQIGAELVGDMANDRLGNGGVAALGNNNYVIASPFDDEGGITNAGSVRLANGTTGAQIGAALVGDVTNDQLSGNGITALGNNNYVIASRNDDEGGILQAGSVRLVDGGTGVPIGTALVGDVAFDQLGGSGITALSNNNYVIASGFDDEGGIVNSGSVRLVNGSTGVQIGTALVGDVASDRLGVSGTTALGNNNYVIASFDDDEGGVVDAGSVRLINGSTGVQIGAALVGDVADDQLGNNGITALSNNNYVIASPSDDEGGIVDSGSVRLVDGTTGTQIGAALIGDTASDQLGDGGVTALSNNNYIIVSPSDDEGGIVDAGSVRLANGSTGAQVATALVGDMTSDQLGLDSVTALGNNNYVIASSEDDEAGIVDAGSVRLADGNTGAQINAALTGDVAGDQLGLDSITVLNNNNYVIASASDDESGIVDAGSIRQVNGGTGEQVGASIVGASQDDMLNAGVTSSLSGNFYILSQPFADNGGQVDSGMVRIVVR